VLKLARAQWTLVAALIVIVALASVLVLQPHTTVTSIPTTTTTTATSTTSVPCQSPKLMSDLAIGNCLDARINVATRQMDSKLREESVYFHYDSRSRDWRVARKTQSTYLAYVRQECVAQAHPYQSGTIVPILYSECELSFFGQRLHDIERALTTFQGGGEAESTS
jgi:uncharacterized protein YecT (DUF1311 family)